MKTLSDTYILMQNSLCGSHELRVKICGQVNRSSNLVSKSLVLIRSLISVYLTDKRVNVLCLSKNRSLGVQICGQVIRSLSAVIFGQINKCSNLVS